MYSVTAMIDQLNWQKLKNHRDNSHFSTLCSTKFMFLLMTFHHQHPQLQQDHHMKEIFWYHMQEQMHTNIYSSHIQLLYGINYKKQLRNSIIGYF